MIRILIIYISVFTILKSFSVKKEIYVQASKKQVANTTSFYHYVYYLKMCQSANHNSIRAKTNTPVIWAILEHYKSPHKAFVDIQGGSCTC